MNEQTWIVFLGTLAFAGAAGMLAPFVTLRRESFSGDITAHAGLTGIFFVLALPGITPATLKILAICGGITFAYLAHFILNFLKHETTLPHDLLLGIVLALFISLALIFLTTIISTLTTSSASAYNTHTSALLRRYIFGNPAALSLNEALLLLTIAILTLSMLLCFYKIWTLIAFQAEWAQTLGFSIHYAQWAFKLIFIIVIMAGTLSLGALMVSAMVVAPSLAATSCVNRLFKIIVLSTLLNLSATASALFLGAHLSGIPEAPTAVFLITFLSVILVFTTKLRKKRNT